MHRILKTLVIMLLLAVAASAVAQTTATISGTVVDPPPLAPPAIALDGDARNAALRVTFSERVDCETIAPQCSYSLTRGANTQAIAFALPEPFVQFTLRGQTNSPPTLGLGCGPHPTMRALEIEHVLAELQDLTRRIGAA